MKGKHTSKPIDEMLDDETVQVEFEEADLRLMHEEGSEEAFNRHFDQEYKRLLHHGTPDEIASDIKRVVGQLMIKAGHPAAEDKIYVSLRDHTYCLADDNEWKEGPLDDGYSLVGTRGLNWWLGRFEGDPTAEEYKWMMLLRAALDLEQASTTKDREMAIFRLGKVDERLKLHNKHLAHVRTGRKVQDGASQGALASKANNGDAASRLALMFELVDQQGMSVLGAANKLERQGRGRSEANRKLFKRAREKKQRKSWDTPHDVPNRWFS